MFKYNSEGLRVQKTVTGTVTNYTMHGKNIVHVPQGATKHKGRFLVQMEDNK